MISKVKDTKKRTKSYIFILLALTGLAIVVSIVIFSNDRFDKSHTNNPDSIEGLDTNNLNDNGGTTNQVSTNETHKLIQNCEVEAFNQSNLHLSDGSVVVSEMPPHDIIEVVDYSGSHCPHTIKNLSL